MSEDHTSFMNIIRNSEAAQKRLADLSERVISDARDRGVTLTPDDCINIREVRLASLGAEWNQDDYERELMQLPAMSDVATRRAIEEGNEEVRNAAVADLYRGRDSVRPEHRAADSSARLSRARNLGIATPATTATDDRDEKLQVLRDIEDHQTRLKLARKWNLI